MKKYFLHNGDKHDGPFTIDELKLKGIEKDTPIWFEGVSDWTKASELDELKELFIVIPPPLNKESIIESSVPIPPAFEKKDTNSAEESSDKTKSKKISKTLLYWVGAGAIVLMLIIFLIVKNSHHQAELENVAKANEALNSQVSAVKQEIDRQNEEIKKQEQEKENQLKAVAQKEMYYRNNWGKFIKATTGTYSYKDFGGILNLGVTVYNQTEYILDEVTVAIDYIKANGGVYKTENVTLYNLSAKDAKRVGAPDSDRGTSVQLRIVNIKARAFKFCYDFYGVGSGDETDKWQCN